MVAANNQGCPSGIRQIANQVALSITNGDTVTAGLKWAALTNSVVQIGIGASGAYQAAWSPLGWGGSGSVTLAFDPQGNIGLAVSYGNGPTFGEGVMGGVQFSRSPNAQSIFALNGPSTSRGAGAADGFGASYDYSNNAGGTDTLMVGGGIGGIGSFKNTGPTTVYPLVCR